MTKCGKLVGKADTNFTSPITSSSHVFTNSETTNLRFFFPKILFVFVFLQGWSFQNRKKANITVHFQKQDTLQPCNLKIVKKIRRFEIRENMWWAHTWPLSTCRNRIVSLLVYKSHFFSDPLIKRLRHNAHQLRPEKNYFFNKNSNKNTIIYPIFRMSSFSIFLFAKILAMMQLFITFKPQNKSIVWKKSSIFT